MKSPVVGMCYDSHCGQNCWRVEMWDLENPLDGTRWWFRFFIVAFIVYCSLSIASSVANRAAL